jgi:FtsZ-interacting cell division protein ZipA
MADDDGKLWGFWNDPASGAREILLIVGALCLIALVGFIWAAFWRKPRRRRHTYHHLHPSDECNGGLPARRKSKFGLFGRKRHRTQRRRERSANPTLSQVGGLPPPRRDPPPGP